MPTKLVVNDYVKEKYPEYIGLTLVPKDWHPEDEDSIFCECVERPELGRYFFYLWLENWSIERKGNL